jgi:hypothetical protein
VLTTSDGNPLEPAKTISRRKKLCKNWWNHQWLSRLFAISSWLSDGKSEIELCTTENGSLSIAAISTCVTVDYGINESSKNSLEQINSDDNCIDIIDIDELEENLDIIEEDEIDE